MQPPATDPFLFSDGLPRSIDNSHAFIEELAGIFETRPCEELFSSKPPHGGEAAPAIDADEPSPLLNEFSDVQLQEPSVNTETNVYNYCSSTDPETKVALTDRLYASLESDPCATSFADVESSPSSVASPCFSACDAMDTTPAKAGAVNSSVTALACSNDIERSIQNFHGSQIGQLSLYLERWLRRTTQADYYLQILHGWKKDADPSQYAYAPSDIAPSAFGDQHPQSTGGFYIRWNNKGIVVNPGKNFMHHFHQAGLHIKDIDVVVMTHAQADTYADVQEINDLNLRMNRVSGDQQVIHYYINHKHYQNLSALLQPRSKAERNAIHSLELFAESPEIEQIKLGEGIVLHYFSTQLHSLFNQPALNHSHSTPDHLGIRFDLSRTHHGEVSHFSIGYVSGMGWSPFIGQHVARCDVLIAGIGNTHQSDYNKVIHLDECLGYYGISSLLEDVHPKLLLCAEFGAREGDLRLELMKKMRSEHNGKSTEILPADLGMCVDLKALTVKCSATKEYVDPSQIRVIRSTSFGPLHYLAPVAYL